MPILQDGLDRKSCSRRDGYRRVLQPTSFTRLAVRLSSITLTRYSTAMSKKRLVILLAVMVGFVGAAVVARWPEHAAVIQMVMYSVTVLGLMIVGFWPDRHQPRFAIALLAAVLVHIIVLILMREVFPFKTVITI